MKKNLVLTLLAVITFSINSNSAEAVSRQMARPGLVLEEFVFESSPFFRSCHAATVLELRSGELLCAFFSGTRESHPDVEIRLSRKPVGGEWTPPVSVADGNESGGERMSTGNPVLFQERAGKVMLFYKVIKPNVGFLGRIKTSSDGGRTWSEGRKVGDDLMGAVKNKPIQLDNGTILSPSSTEDDHGWRVHIERSTDGGKTWKLIGPINPEAKIGAIQPTLMTYPDDRIQMLCRTRSEHGFIAQSWSEDDGLTWSPLEAAVLPNNNSGIDAVALRDGRQLLVYNHSTRTQPGMGHKGRGILNVALSHNGIDWEAALVLEHLDEQGKQFSYPSVIQTRDGLVHIVYTWHRQRIKHVVLDPKGLETTPMPDGKWPTDTEPRATDGRLRVIMSSDFPPIGVVKEGDVPNTMKSDPDDMQSMVRFLLYANEFDIEGLIASAGTFAMEAYKKNILSVLDQYEKVYENLRKHDPGYPTVDYLRSVTFEGKGNNHGIPVKWGHNKQPYTDIIGEGMDSEASNAIIAVADKPDPRPLWIGVWGGPREVAQAIWDVKNTRSEEELKAFISKLRVFLIAYQDATHGWLMDEFPDLFIIDSRKTYQGMFGGRDPVSNLAWINENIRHNHGPLCDVYPHEGMGCTGVCEGDSSTFLYLVSANRGINDPEDPTQPSWGGQYKRKANTNHYVDGPGGSSISRWRKDYQKEFAERADWCISHPSALAAPHKPRVIVLTDISPVNHEPDDMESMIRLLVHADLFEIEGLIATTGWSYSQATTDSLDLIHKVIDAYEKDLPNLLKRSGQTDFLSDESRQEIGYWPSPDYLRKRAVMGSKTRGQSHIGKSNDSPGSKLIIQIAGESDDRPVWIQAWGGGNTLAQAIWRVREEQTEDDLKAFLRKIRMYTITDQDRSYKRGTPFDISSHQWMRREFEKDLFFIWDECAWKFQNGTGKSNWDEYATHIQKHGNLGKMYPKYRYGVEGDTPAFLYTMPVGLNNPDIPEQGSWGGYFEWSKGPDNETYAYTNHQSPVYSICRELEEYFYEATFNNFAARMDWAKDGVGNRNPIVAVNGNKGIDIITLAPQHDTAVTLDASKSYDPDGDDLTFNWWIISGPGTYTQNIKISNSKSSRATVDVPEDSAGKTFHVICEVTDDGIHNLTSYRRIIFEPVQ